MDEVTIISMKPKMLKDISHAHKLELKHLDRKAVINNCEACTQEIIDDWYYDCPKPDCNHFLHKVCAELRLEMKHGLHTARHTLKLMVESGRDCRACFGAIKGYCYDCKECWFVLDIICATASMRMLEHIGHQHPLTLQRRESSTYCNACGEEHKGIFYHCNVCVVFAIHQDCAALGDEIEHSDHHPHPLYLDCSDESNFINDCDVCTYRIDHRRSWHFQCEPCGFHAHTKCAISSEKEEEIDESNLEIPRLPWEDVDGEFGVVGLLNRNSMNDNVKLHHPLLSLIMKVIKRNDEKQVIKSHFSHPQHPLILQTDLPTVEDPYHGHRVSIQTKCNGCTRNITAPFYSCADCSFFLHKCCALIPTSLPPHLTHAKHRGGLALIAEPWSDTLVFICHCCYAACNGFLFQCTEKDCRFKIDLECAFLPTTIVHKSHPNHILDLYEHDGNIPTRKKKCCDESYCGGRTFIEGYACRSCNFAIGTQCAMYPAKTSHRLDHEHPLKLWYDRGAVEANHFYCDICERYLTPKSWYYHSKNDRCDQLMHPRCIVKGDYNQDGKYVKFKSTDSLFLQADIHPHAVHLAPLSSNDDSCHCGKCISSAHTGRQVGYVCHEDSCDFQIHLTCARELQDKSSSVWVNMLKF